MNVRAVSDSEHREIDLRKAGREIEARIQPYKFNTRAGGHGSSLGRRAIRRRTPQHVEIELGTILQAAGKGSNLMAILGTHVRME